MPLGIVFATSFEGIFARGSSLPWICPPDMSYFKSLTSGATVVMGRKTADSLPKSLPGRKNLVLSRSKYERFGFDQVDIDELPEIWRKEPVFVIGGARIIEYFIDNFLSEIDLISQSSINLMHYPPDDDVFEKEPFYFELAKETFEGFHREKVSLAKGVLLNLYIRKYNKDLPLIDDQYLKLGRKIVNQEPRMGRNGETRSSFAPDFVISTSFKDGFPVLKSKRVWMKGVVEEADFFWEGKTDTKELEEKGVKIWTGNTSAEFIEKLGKTGILHPGEMGPMYGFQWRHFGAPYRNPEQGYDQIQALKESIIADPHGRRHLLTTYNPAQVKDGVLAACHGIATQFYVEKDMISLKTYQRSADWFLGVPFNLSSYAYILLKLIDEINATGLTQKYRPGRVTTIFGDAHLYEQHIPVFMAQYAYSHFVGDKMSHHPIFNMTTKEIEDYTPLKKYVAPMIA